MSENEIEWHVYHVDWGGAEEWWVAESEDALVESIKEHLGDWGDAEARIHKLPDDELVPVFWGEPIRETPERAEVQRAGDSPEPIPTPFDARVVATAAAWADFWKHDDLYLASTEY